MERVGEERDFSVINDDFRESVSSHQNSLSFSSHQERNADKLHRELRHLWGDICFPLARQFASNKLWLGEYGRKCSVSLQIASHKVVRLAANNTSKPNDWANQLAVQACQSCKEPIVKARKTTQSAKFAAFFALFQELNLVFLTKFSRPFLETKDLI